jgi:hypothetical protein
MSGEHIHRFDSDVGYATGESKAEEFRRTGRALEFTDGLSLLCACGASMDLFPAGGYAIYGPTNSKLSWKRTGS